MQKITDGIIDSVVNLGAAATSLAISQLGTLATGVFAPEAALRHVTQTMNQLSEAMLHATGPEARALETATRMQVPLRENELDGLRPRESPWFRTAYKSGLGFVLNQLLFAKLSAGLFRTPDPRPL